MTSPAPRKILIDTDPGIDDAMAILMAFAHPGLEVVGLTTVFGNVHVEVATRNALLLAEMAGASCPVAEGADRPLVQPLQPPAYFVHGPEGFGDHPKSRPSRQPDLRTAARLIVDTINENPGEIWLCPIGPLTNIAHALRLEPAIARKVAGVVIMGGAVACPGNVTQHAEANIWNDPHAAAVVLGTDWPMTLVGLDVTETVRCGPEDFQRIEADSPVIGGFLNTAVQFYFEWHKSKPHYRHAPFEGCFMHDPTAVLTVADPSLISGPTNPVHVITEGDEIGRTLADPKAGTCPVQLATDVDATRVRQQFLDITAMADAHREG